MEIKGKKIAFVVGTFPAISETWLINQVAESMERGIKVEIFYFKKSPTDNISEKYYEYNMGEISHHIGMPENRLERIIKAVPKAVRLFLKSPSGLLGALNFKKYGKDALSLKLLFWAEPFAGKKFDLYHCHFGPVANRFLIIREILGIKQKFITSFYGYDTSKVFSDHPNQDVYKQLKRESSAFIVMSEVMKRQIVDHGFDEKKIHILPIFGIDVDDYPFKERHLNPGEPIQMVTVGRFVEKKGFDDLMRAIAIVKNKTNKKFVCNIIGGGKLESQLYGLAKELNLGESISFKGFMKIEDVINYFKNMCFYLQPSKTASDGDHE